MIKRVFVLISLVVAVLVIGGNAFACIPNPPLGPNWKLVYRDSDGTMYYVNTREITYLPKGVVEVWELFVPRGEGRRIMGGALKYALLFKGKDQNNAERLWYIIELDKFNCKRHQIVIPERIFYSFGGAVLLSQSFQYEGWDNIYPGGVGEAIEKYACKKHRRGVWGVFAQGKIPKAPASMPDPSLSSKWKLLITGSYGSTLYVNTRRITYLPGGIVKVQTLLVPRGEFRRKVVNLLKKRLASKGKDPNKAERLWYDIELNKINCKTHQYAPLEDISYSFGQAVLAHHSFQHEEWKDIPLGSADEVIERYMCKKHK